MTRFISLSLSLVALTACGQTPEAELDQFRENFGAFEDCGFVTLGQCGSGDSSELLTAGACLEAALADCTPSEATIVRPTIEGDPITTTYFVVPGASACEVVRFTDTTQDAFGDGEMLRERCDGVEVVDTDPTCPMVEATECRPELVY